MTVSINRVIDRCDEEALTERLATDLSFALMSYEQWHHYFENRPRDPLFKYLAYFSQLHLLWIALKWRTATVHLAQDAAAAAPAADL